MHGWKAGRKAVLTQGRAGRDRADGSLAVAELGRDGEGALLADAHVQESLVPAKKRVRRTSATMYSGTTGQQLRRRENSLYVPLDDLSAAELEGERRAAVVA